MCESVVPSFGVSICSTDFSLPKILTTKISPNSMGISQLVYVLHIHKGFQAQAFSLNFKQ